MKRIMLGTSDTTSHLSQQYSEPAQYTIDCQILVPSELTNG